MTTYFKNLPIEQLQRGHYQPRRHFDETALTELAQSIKTQGLIEPLIVRALTDNQYEIIAGERRWRASFLAGIHEIPCLIGHYSDQQALAITLIENIQREQLSLLEEAAGYHRLITEFVFTQEDIALLIGKSRSHIANILRLLTLPESVKTYLNAQQLTLGHARMLVGLPTASQIVLAKKAYEQEWSVRRLEEEVRHYKSNIAVPQKKSAQIDTIHLQNHLSEQVGAPVEISPGPGHGGWLKIKYFDNDTLAGLLERMRLSYD